MDNLTHSLVGLTAAKAGLEKLSPGATAVCLLAANAPDADIVVLLFGDRWAFLQHHRGLSHSIIGTACLALILPLVFYLFDKTIAYMRSRPATVKLRQLLIVSIVVSATHPLLDWTNNYGIQLLLPWSSRWFYGDLVFIVDPLIWILFGGAAFLLTSPSRVQQISWAVLAVVISLLVFLGPTRRGGLSHPHVLQAIWIVAVGCLLALFAFRVGSRLGPTLARAAFVVLGGYLGFLAVLHGVAINESREHAAQIARINGEQVSRIVAMPTLANPLRWECVFETESATYRFNLTLPNTTSDFVRYENLPAGIKALIQPALEDRRATILLGFARFPVITVANTDCTTQTLVQFADLRYTEPGGSRGVFSLEVPIECNRPITK
ncbi:MAG: metal-dependent hydrolase [Pyrinomonadaceae bacterium]